MSDKGATSQLKQVLGFKELLSTAVGQIIGAGIMTLLGSAIGLTGRSVPIAFMVAAVLIVGLSIPMIIIPGTVNVRGGQYTMVAMMAGKTMSGAFIILFVLSNISLAMYGISFANYFIPFFGVGTTKVVALAVLTVFFVLNCFGIDKMARFQNLIVLAMCISLGLLAAFGIGHLESDYLTNGFMLNGISGLLQASGLLTFAVGGGYVIVNLSAEAKNPTKDIPKAIIISTLAVAVLYAFVAVVAAGVLPVEEVANQSLGVVAKYVLPAPVYAFFMVCGAMFAIISTLNAQYAWATKPLLQACDDGWLPKQLAYIHPKYKTPIVLLVIYYVFAVVSVIGGLDVSVLGNISIIATYLVFFIISVCMWRLPIVAPKAWENSKYKVSPLMMKVLVVFSALCAVINIYLNAIQLTRGIQIANVIVVIAAFVFAYVRRNHATVNVEVEE